MLTLRPIVAHLNSLLEAVLWIELSSDKGASAYDSLKSCLLEIATAWSVDLYKRLLGEPYKDSAKQLVNTQLRLALQEAVQNAGALGDKELLALLQDASALWGSYWRGIDALPEVTSPDPANAIRQLSSLIDVIERACAA